MLFRSGWQVYFGNDYFCMVSNNSTDLNKHDITILCGKQEIGTLKNILFLKAVVQQYFNRVMSNNLVSR